MTTADYSLCSSDHFTVIRMIIQHNKAIIRWWMMMMMMMMMN